MTFFIGFKRESAFLEQSLGRGKLHVYILFCTPGAMRITGE